MIPGVSVSVFVSNGFDIVVVNISRSCDMTVTKILSVEERMGISSTFTCWCILIFYDCVLLYAKIKSICTRIFLLCI